MINAHMDPVENAVQAKQKREDGVRVPRPWRVGNVHPGRADIEPAATALDL